jgi:hypothetical protein
MIVATITWTEALDQMQQLDLRGAWDVNEYVMKDGTKHATKGHILFAGTDWTVLFFIINARGEVNRGSAEGGTYTLKGNDLVLRHHYNLSVGKAMQGLPESPLRMDVIDAEHASTEPTKAELAGDRLTICFPSGNKMVFKRRTNS